MCTVELYVIALTLAKHCRPNITSYIPGNVSMPKLSAVLPFCCQQNGKTADNLGIETLPGICCFLPSLDVFLPLYAGV